MGIFLDDDDDDGGGGHHSGKTNWSSLIGIVTAIVGNALIALALNVQRYAHIRLHKRRAEIRARVRQALKKSANGRAYQGRTPSAAPLVASGGGLYGAAGGAAHGRSGSHAPTPKTLVDAEPAETQPLAPNYGPDSSDYSSDEGAEPAVEAITYLKDPYWWLGQFLITLGECGNFISYGFAPASIVSPLGVVALVSNCIIAPLFFREVFRQRDFWGVIVAVGGAVTVVLSAKQEETKLGPHDVWDAITTIEFETYMGLSCALIVLLMWLSPHYGTRTITIDLGLVGLFGGYTALSTKGVSSMLSSTLLGAFTTPVTYGLLFVLLATALLQVRYVNKALQRFDSTQVIPIQFVLFTLSVIIGSAVLYRDFERTTAEQAAKFIGGCLLTFFGVFLITSGRPRADHDEEALSDDEDMDETIRLAEQEPSTPQDASSGPRSRRASDPARSRRSSRASIVSLRETLRPGSLLADSGIPSHRVPSHASNLRTALRGDELMDSPLLTNPWREGRPLAIRPPHPSVEHATRSSDSVPSVMSISASDVPSMPATPQTRLPQIITQDLPEPHHTSSYSMAPERPVTPRASAPAGGGGSRPHSHHYGAALISPSPFSSTVSAVVADKILAQRDSATLRRVVSRRSRVSLGNSLFVPTDELFADGECPDLDNQFESAIEPGYEHQGGREADQLQPGPGHGGMRGRARSLSHTLGDWFGMKKK